MPQRLLFPFRRGMIICGYKTAQYEQSWGYPHYGIDISSIQGVKQPDNVVRASGDGVVVWCTYDTTKYGAKSLGWALAVRYNDCVSRSGAIKNLVVRYMHASKCHVVKGQTVKAGDPLIDEGTVGTNGYHVHMEMDTDVRPAYYHWSPQVSDGHSGWAKGNDSTVNPSLWLWQSADTQTEPYSFTNRKWINTEDTNLPWVPEDNNARISELEKQIADLTARIERMKALAAQISNV